MSFPLLPRGRRAVRTAVAAGVLLVAAAPAAEARTAPVSASAPDTPWTSVSDVLAESLQWMGTATRTSAGTAPRPAAAPTPQPTPAPRTFATVDGIPLVTPSTDLHAIGFHEGATRGLTLTPVGEPVANERGIALPPAAPGPDYLVMGSRGRAAAPTSAVDLAMDVGDPVQSVVTGTVVAVSPYQLYGETPDVLVEIVPDGRPDVKVQMFHVEAPKVAVGDRVVAGETVVAGGPRLLPFPSQIDRHVGHAGPHVHVQAVTG